ncbi:phosphatase PAP2 family protein [Agilicoccus flavus]|uniref:phosphatase PAP2 family protein n=1 Tax=Agilicoccus flavus TaxID=2775968 RepID=UPI001CF623C6|nr:phosphatase PAP2 family protein [Agilicoccus flavus]
MPDRPRARPHAPADPAAADLGRRRLVSLGRRLAPRVGRGLLAAALTVLPVGALAGVVKAQVGPLVPLDRAAILAATDVTRTHPGLLSALVAWQEVFLPGYVYLMTVPVLVFAWRRGLRSRTLWALPTMLVGWNLGLDVKLLVRRARPEYADPISAAPGWSFPSGHVFNMTMACVCCLVLLWPLLRRPAARVAACAVAGVLVVVTMLDRVFLGVHYPSDTVGGVLLAFALAFSSWVGYAGLPRRRRR